MKLNFFKDFFTLLGFVILEETIYFLLGETNARPRSLRDGISLIGSMSMVVFTTITLYQRYKPFKIAIVYGILFGVFAYLFVHIIPYPTKSNTYIIYYKLGLITLFVLIFQEILRIKLRKKNESTSFHDEEI